MLVFVVLGGIGNIWGSIIAATLLTVLPELLRGFSDYRMLVYAVVLILVMLVTNSPLTRAFFARIVPHKRRRRTGKEARRHDSSAGSKTKMVPFPSHSIVPERDVDKLPVLEARHLGIEFGGLKAVEDFNLTIGKTEIAGLIGPNGAGKTTVFNLLTKVYQPTSGTVMINGKDTAGMNTVQANKLGVARTFQNIRLFGNMSVEDNVRIGLHNQVPVRHVLRHLPPAAPTGSRRRSSTSRRWSCFPSSTCRTWPRQAPARCPTARSGGWRSCARWPRTPRCCCWTSPPPA